MTTLTTEQLDELERRAKRNGSVCCEDVLALIAMARRTAEAETLREALGPFARWATDHFIGIDDEGYDQDFLLTADRYAASESDLRRAAAALATTAPETEVGS